MSVYRRILRGAEQTCRYWVALEEEKCIGQNYHTLRNFCEERELSLSRHGHSVMSENQFYQVFMFAIEEHAEIFRKEFGGERMHPSEKGQRDALGAVEQGNAQAENKGPLQLFLIIGAGILPLEEFQGLHQFLTGICGVPWQ